MIEILQKPCIKDNMIESIVKCSRKLIKFDEELIKSDIDKLSSQLNKTYNKYNKRNIKALIKYLNNMLRETDDNGCIEINWKVDDDRIVVSEPFDFINEPLYDINTCNYIKLKDANYIELDTTEIVKLISLEFMYRDIDFSLSKFEEKFKDVGLLTIKNSNELLADTEEDLAGLYKIMNIENSPYYCYDTKKIRDYFMTKEFDAKSYRDVITYSCRYANMFIMASIMDKMHTGIKCNIVPLIINPSTLAFIDLEPEGDRSYIDDVVIRIFGRKFKVKIPIKIY